MKGVKENCFARGGAERQENTCGLQTRRSHQLVLI